MIKKYQKFICAGIYFFVFLFIGLFYLSINRVFADLEVTYPTIGTTSLAAGAKLPDYVLYLFNAGMFLGVFAVFISLAIAGVMYFLSPARPDLLASAKDRVSGAISGLLILVLTYLIITTINPQLIIFNLNALPPVSSPPVETGAPGVYFHKSAGCSDNSIQPNTSSIPDLGPLKNKVNSVNIIQGDNSYITILYNNINFWGKCQYISNSGCTGVTPFAASASIYSFDFNPNGDGVYFYRKSYFNEQGGYLFVSNSDIQNAGSSKLYVGDLDQLKFTGDSSSGDCTVPEEEQDCIKYNKYGKCIQRSCPTLAGENISSVKINGDYLVLFVYSAQSDAPSGPWTSCQEFPSVDDVNKLGPQQIKWEDIKNSGGVIPNYVIIIPI